MKCALLLLLSIVSSQALAADFYLNCQEIENKLTKAFCAAMRSKLQQAPEHNVVTSPEAAVELGFETQVTETQIIYRVREKIGDEIAEEYKEATAKTDRPGPAIDKLIVRLTQRQVDAQAEYDEDERKAQQEMARQQNDPAYQQQGEEEFTGHRREGPFFSFGTFSTRGLGEHNNQTQYSLGLLRGRGLGLFLVRLQLAHDTGSSLTNYAALDLGGGVDFRIAKRLFVQATGHLGYGVTQRYKSRDEVEFDPLVGYDPEIDTDRGTTLGLRLGFGVAIGNIDLSLLGSAITFAEENRYGNYPIFQGIGLQLMATVD